jgi:hypothetical protein
LNLFLKIASSIAVHHADDVAPPDVGWQNVMLSESMSNIGSKMRSVTHQHDF